MDHTVPRLMDLALKRVVECRVSPREYDVPMEVHELIHRQKLSLSMRLINTHAKLMIDRCFDVSIIPVHCRVVRTKRCFVCWGLMDTNRNYKVTTHDGGSIIMIDTHPSCNLGVPSRIMWGEFDAIDNILSLC
jgi:hypothetical protein